MSVYDDEWEVNVDMKRGELIALVIFTVVSWSGGIVGVWNDIEADALNAGGMVGYFMFPTILSLWLLYELRSKRKGALEGSAESVSSSKSFLFGTPNKVLMRYFVLLFVVLPVVAIFAFMIFYSASEVFSYMD